MSLLLILSLAILKWLIIVADVDEQPHAIFPESSYC